MKTLFFDCFAGISGDMTLGALVGAGADAGALVEQLALLGVPGYEVRFERAERAGIAATRAVVSAREEKHHRHLADIERIVDDSRLGGRVKSRAKLIFGRLAEAEARVHGVAVERIHFHEVGALDSIVDVVGACVGFELLGVERFVCSPLHVGSGTVEMAHGRFPVPPPAVAELLRGAPVYSTEVRGELVTPTGAAIVATLCEGFGPLPPMTVESTGYGAGSRDYEKFPNVLRVLVGESAGEGAGGDEKLLMVETNIDDASPQLLGHLMERAFAEGALDCFFTPAQMKKNRPGVLVSLLCRPADRERMYALLFAETTTIGARCYEVERRALERVYASVHTKFGGISVKVARSGGRVVGATPEYESCRAAAEREGVPFRVVEEAARTAFHALGPGCLEEPESGD
ncbi:MAG TPA: nickel pincer cofactor biosynthesis protein LarC [Pyrinomonadaceae bacterium]|nr:nickel pincer cofactor biosynthesis protein LarC [Pyrinomonadaceae bacterium]